MTVPTNTVARIHVPASQAAQILTGGEPLSKTKKVKVIGSKDGYQVVEVGSGFYEFVVR
ncbi:hypothetical protein [Dyadobacter sp. CY323]|uniref:hypothetical protein n=1 Tax=Dyadobacter sp. CY323 TaxID=2907302 RepID=UPI001F284521|nr:hypothetical protein [Dyadobacter sp. CY323]